MKNKKMKLINTVLLSNLAAGNKLLLIELLMRSDDDGFSWPSVQRLCMVRGITHEKNFKGADHYLPGLVTKGKNGRKNTYTLNIKAIEALRPAEVTIKHTLARPAANEDPAHQGLGTPDVAVNTPASAENDPELEGANSTKNNTTDSSSDSSITSVADAPDVENVSLSLGSMESFWDYFDSLNPSKEPPAVLSTTSSGRVSAQEGASATASEPRELVAEQW